MALIVHVLSIVTSLLCAVLLLRGWRRSHVRLLLWSGLAFVFFTLNNLGLVIDLHVTGPETDLSVLRTVPSLIGGGLLLFGLIWDTR